jgi:hypothetical protein
LAARRQNLQYITNKLFKNIVNDAENKLHDFLPPVNSSEICLRGRIMFQISNFKILKFACLTLFAKLEVCKELAIPNVSHIGNPNFGKCPKIRTIIVG